MPDLFNDDKIELFMDQSTTANTEAVRPDVYNSANIADSAIKRPFVTPHLLFRVSTTWMVVYSASSLRVIALLRPRWGAIHQTLSLVSVILRMPMVCGVLHLCE